MSLSKLMEEIENAERASKLVVDGAPIQIQPSLLIAKVDGERRLKELREKFETQVLGSTAVVLLVGGGERAERFVATAEEEAGSITVSGEELYERLAQAVDPILGRTREFGGVAYNLFVGELSAIARDLGLESLARPGHPSRTVMATVDELKRELRDLVLDSGDGSAVNAAYIRSKIAKTAMELRYSKAVLPVVITGLSEAEALSLQGMFAASVIVDVKDEEVNKEFVLKAFSTLKKQFRNR